MEFVDIANLYIKYGHPKAELTVKFADKKLNSFTIDVDQNCTIGKIKNLIGQNSPFIEQLIRILCDNWIKEDEYVVKPNDWTRKWICQTYPAVHQHIYSPVAGDIDNNKFDFLVNLGYSTKHAELALISSNNDLQTAISILQYKAEKPKYEFNSSDIEIEYKNNSSESDKIEKDDKNDQKQGSTNNLIKPSIIDDSKSELSQLIQNNENNSITKLNKREKESIFQSFRMKTDPELPKNFAIINLNSQNIKRNTTSQIIPDKHAHISNSEMELILASRNDRSKIPENYWKYLDDEKDSSFDIRAFDRSKFTTAFGREMLTEGFAISFNELYMIYLMRKNQGIIKEADKSETIESKKQNKAKKSKTEVIKTDSNENDIIDEHPLEVKESKEQDHTQNEVRKPNRAKKSKIAIVKTESNDLINEPKKNESSNDENPCIELTKPESTTELIIKNDNSDKNDEKLNLEELIRQMREIVVSEAHAKRFLHDANNVPAKAAKLFIRYTSGLSALLFDEN